MQLQEIGEKLVQLCNAGRGEDAVAEFYADNIVSIEGADGDGGPARIEGIEAVKQKGAWWEANHEIHGFAADGPFIGKREDQFVVKFDLDVTPKGAERMQMTEVGLYTVKNDKIVQEEFLYHT